jgi:Protein of unknown function (DUF3574)
MIRVWEWVGALSFLVNDPLLPASSSGKMVNAPQSCPEGRLIKEELYFGLSKPTGDNVSAREWQKFLRQVVSPRFKEGMTVVNADGQYLNRSGKLILEPSKILILIYQPGAVPELAIADIISSYKTSFGQESVLRVRACIQATF